jgi:predicted XRE-type DNA-binding protein
MTKKLDLVRGSGNVFRDFGDPNPDVEQMKSVLAAQIIMALDDRQLSVRNAAEITGITGADFSRIRRAKIDRFTIDRLVTILNKLGRRVDVSVSVASKNKAKAQPAPAVYG